MAKKDKSINPADAHRRAQHKKEVKKNKLERKRLREQNLLQKDPNKIAADIAKYTRLDEEGRLDAAGKQKLQRLIVGKQKIEEARKEASKNVKDNDQVEETAKLPKDPTRSVHYHPTLNPFGIPPPGQVYKEIEGDHDKQEDQGEAAHKEEISENSSQSDWDSLSDSEASEPEIEIEMPDAPVSEVPFDAKEEALPVPSMVENTGSSHTTKADAEKQANEQLTLPSPPPGSPPDFALSSIPGLDFLPSLPLGPPPPDALIFPRPPPPHPAYIDYTQHALPQMTSFDRPPLPFVPNFGPLRPLPGFPPQMPNFPAHFPPHMQPEFISNQNNPCFLPPLPPPLPPQNFHARPNFPVPPPPPVGGPPMRPLDRMPSRAHAPQQRQNFSPPYAHPGASTHYRGQVDILSQPSQFYPRSSSQATSQAKISPKNVDPSTSSSHEGSVISAEPKLRDLKKELTTLVPTSLLRKHTKVSSTAKVASDTKDPIIPSITPHLTNSSHGVGIRLFRPKINAAPDLDDDSPPSTTAPSAPLISSSLLYPTKPPPSTPAITQTSTPVNASKDDYEAFMKEMEGLL